MYGNFKVFFFFDYWFYFNFVGVYYVFGKFFFLSKFFSYVYCYFVIDFFIVCESKENFFIEFFF